MAKNHDGDYFYITLFKLYHPRTYRSQLIFKKIKGPLIINKFMCALMSIAKEVKFHLNQPEQEKFKQFNNQQI